MFPDLDARFRVLSWPGREYVLGTDAARSGIVANLRPGQWTVARHDVVAKVSQVLAESIRPFHLRCPGKPRLVLFHFKRSDTVSESHP